MKDNTKTNSSTEEENNRILDLMNIAKNMYEPTTDGVLVILPKVEEKTKSGVIKGNNVLAEEKEKVANEMFILVAAIGPLCKNVKVGDKVNIRSNVRPDGVMLEGNLYGQISECHILGRLKV
jgi:co-chaperonin GroES (HSP10)